MKLPDVAHGKRGEESMTLRRLAPGVNRFARELQRGSSGGPRFRTASAVASRLNGLRAMRSKKHVTGSDKSWTASKSVSGPAMMRG